MPTESRVIYLKVENALSPVETLGVPGRKPGTNVYNDLMQEEREMLIVSTLVRDTAVETMLDPSQASGIDTPEKPIVQ